MFKRRNSVRAWKREHGQTLILVAASMLVLLLFAALAVDVGFWYGQRRHMQNAADAGALAGAWEICFGNPGSAESAALDYAEHNGADRSLTIVGIDDSTGTIVVTATTGWQPFLARSVVSEMTAGAAAAAQCGPANQGCGMWPVALDMASYISDTLTGACNGPTDWDDGAFIATLPTNSGAGRNPNSQFILWADDNESYDPAKVEKHCRFLSNPEGESNEYQLANVVGGSPMDPGSRGWIALRLLKGYEIPAGSEWEDCNNTGNCGTSALNCWLKYGYIGSIAIGDCLATGDGIGSSLPAAATKEGEPVSVVLYDHPGGGTDCDASDNPATCQGSKTYHVADIGCVLVEHIFNGDNCKPTCSNDRKSDHIQWEPYELGGSEPWNIEYTIKSSREGYEYYPGLPGTNEYGFGCYKDGKNWVCDNSEPLTFTCPPKKSTGIIVTKLCACPPTTCVGTGGSGGSSAVRAVSLIPVP
jgi:hypothetical protein